MRFLTIAGPFHRMDSFAVPVILLRLKAMMPRFGYI